MKSNEIDAFLRKALLLSNSPEVMGLTEDTQPVSELFQKKMDKLLSNPEKVGRQLLRPKWRKAVHYVACAVLVLTLTIGSVLALSPAAREWVKTAIVEWFHEYANFRFYGENARNPAGYWRPEYLPAGFAVVEADETDGYGTVVYKDTSGSMLYFDSRSNEEGRQFKIDTEHADLDMISVNGHVAYSYNSNNFDTLRQCTLFRV